MWGRVCWSLRRSGRVGWWTLGRLGLPFCYVYVWCALSFGLLYGCCGSGYAEPYMERLWYNVVAQMGMMSNFRQVSEVISFTIHEIMVLNSRQCSTQSSSCRKYASISIATGTTSLHFVRYNRALTIYLVCFDFNCRTIEALWKETKVRFRSQLKIVRYDEV